jgi:hypothetical protein
MELKSFQLVTYPNIGIIEATKQSMLWQHITTIRTPIEVSIYYGAESLHIKANFMLSHRTRKSDREKTSRDRDPLYVKIDKLEI